MTPHNEAKLGEIAKVVLMAGDPLRVKYIAENFLEDAKLVNTVRDAYCYTGKYKGKTISVMAHGMGIPSMGIYSYELYHFYDVDTIIRIGSCGAYAEDLKLLDTILVDKSYTESNYAYTFDRKECKLESASEDINEMIEEVAQEENIKYVKGNIMCTDCFDVYLPDKMQLAKAAPKELNLIGAEMESFALFYNAKREGKRAACLLTVVDVPDNGQGISPEERESSLNDMIRLAFETAVRI